jgi:hypothetical protein
MRPVCEGGAEVRNMGICGAMRLLGMLLVPTQVQVSFTFRYPSRFLTNVVGFGM